MIFDPLRKPPEAISEMPNRCQVTFRLDSVRMGSVDYWQIARLEPLSIGRYLPGSYPVASGQKVSSWELQIPPAATLLQPPCVVDRFLGNKRGERWKSVPVVLASPRLLVRRTLVV